MSPDMNLESLKGVLIIGITVGIIYGLVAVGISLIYTGLDVLAETCRLEQALIQDKRQPKLTFFPLSSNQAKSPITKSQIQELINCLKV